MPGDLTRDQIVTEVCNIVGKSVSAASVSGEDLQTRVRRYLDWAQRRIARHYSFHELTIIKDSTLTSGTKRYDWLVAPISLTRPKDIGMIILLDSANSRRLHRVAYKSFVNRFPRPENYANGLPRIYTRVGNNLEFFYVPDSAYDIRIIYPQWPTPFTSGSQTSDLENKDELLIVMTVMETYLALEEYSDAAAWFNKGLGMLNDSVKVEGDVDWEPQAEPIDLGGIGSLSGTPWTEPGAVPSDPLYMYPDG